MRGMRGVLAGALALVMVQVLVSARGEAADRIAGAPGLLVTAANKLLSPAEPAIAGRPRGSDVDEPPASAAPAPYPSPSTPPTVSA